ncbi:MAG: hypothetical protein PF440_06325 [Thiomicrorhabdus sp.]|nr:hypothetical protein [Thiomicrorhabdus sp.]
MLDTWGLINENTTLPTGDAWEIMNNQLGAIYLKECADIELENDDVAITLSNEEEQAILSIDDEVFDIEVTECAQ